MCLVCGQASNRDMCADCEAHINCRATMAEAGLVECIDLDSPIEYMPISEEVA